MFELIDQISTWLPYTMLVFIRLSAMLLSMPILGYSTVSPRIRIAMAVMLTIIIAPMVGDDFQTTYDSIWALVPDIMREVLIGTMIGFGTRLIFEGFSMAGSFIGFQMGIAIMNVFDPTSQEQQPIISNLWLLVIMIFFLAADSHHFLVTILYQNFTALPLERTAFTPEAGQTIVHGGSLVFDLALRFAAPTMIFLLVMDVAIAFMARVMPQLNIFFISLPLKIGAGIFLLIVSLQIFQVLFSYIYGELETFTYTLIFGMKGA